MKNKILFSVFVYFIILVLLSLGFWQLYRLSWKLDLINQIENSLKVEPIELQNIEKKNYLRIKTSGQIDFEKQIYLYNLNETGKPGFEVVNPIKIGNENYLINRGWISFDKKNKLEKEKYFTYEKVGKYQLIKQVRVENLLNEHTTEVMFSDMVINTGMSDKLFQEMSLRRLPLD